MRYPLLAVLLLSLLTACFPGRPLGYFEVSPYTRTVDTFADETITIVVDRGILESHLVDKRPNKHRHFTRFRTTLEANWTMALQAYFRVVHAADDVPADGYVLRIHRMHPRIVAENVNLGLEGADDLYAAMFDYDIELQRNGKTLRNARGRATGSQKFVAASGWDDGMRSAFELVIEEAFAQLFVDGALSATD